MINLSAFSDKKAAVMGLGRTGLAAAEALIAGGATVLAWDDNEKSRQAATEKHLPLTDLNAHDFADVDMLVWSPGIPHNDLHPHPVAVKAQAKGVELLTDITLLHRAMPDALFIGITGTNGKSTTTALIGHCLETAGIPVALGGNFGVPALSLPMLPEDGIYVIELSSYQLELSPPLHWDGGVWLNLTPDHLERHGTLERYADVKARLFQSPFEGAPRIAAVALDDPHGKKLAQDLRGKEGLTLKTFSAVGKETADILLTTAGELKDRKEDISVIAMKECPGLPGTHNAQNAAACYALLSEFGLSAETIATGFYSFPGLAHRMEEVAIHQGIRFINDSKATNADATANALASYDALYWIAGGRPKQGGIASLARFFPRIKHAFLIGEAADEFATILEGKVSCTKSGTIDQAVKDAAKLAAEKGETEAVLLLSPACASFDQFPNFEARGDAFKGAVLHLIEETSS